MKRIFKLFRIYSVKRKIRSRNGICFGGYKNRMAWFVSPHDFVTEKEMIIIRFLRINGAIVFSGKYKAYPSSRYDLTGCESKIFNTN